MNNSERNKQAHEFQKLGEIEKAIELYEMNVQLKDESPACYNRLITIYSKRKDIENELRILKTYLNISQKRVNEASERSKPEKIEIVEFIQKRIDKAMKILSNDRSEIEDIIISLDQYVKDGNDIENLLDYFSDEIEVSERYEYEFSIKDFLNAISID